MSEQNSISDGIASITNFTDAVYATFETALRGAGLSVDDIKALSKTAVVKNSIGNGVINGVRLD